VSDQIVYRDSQGRFIESAEAQRREMEINFLDSAADMREYIERRNAQRFLVVDPDLPLDEMRASDYIKMRERQESDDRWRPQMGTSYREYFDQKKGEE
jgi:hypothetical protein